MTTEGAEDAEEMRGILGFATKVFLQSSASLCVLCGSCCSGSGRLYPFRGAGKQNGRPEGAAVVKHCKRGQPAVQYVQPACCARFTA